MLSGVLTAPFSREQVESVLDREILEKKVLKLEFFRIPGNYGLWRSFNHHQIYVWYPLDYGRFNRNIYAMFGMDIPFNETFWGERQIAWPSENALHARYVELLKMYHPDNIDNTDFLCQEKRFLCTIKSQMLQVCFNLLRKRRKYLHRAFYESRPLYDPARKRRLYA